MSQKDRPLRTTSKPRPHRYYIVKDDFITNLRKDISLVGEKNKKTEAQEITQWQASSQLISKKKEVQSKMIWRSNNDFYELQKQINNNQKTIFRRLNASLRRSKLDSSFKISNPFLISPGHSSKSAQKFNKDRNLVQLIVQVQPYWIKKYIGRPTQSLK